MNVRAALHGIQAIADAIVLGTIGFAGLSPTVTVDVIAFAAMVNVFLGVYLASTTTGVTQAVMVAAKSWDGTKVA